MKKVGPIIFKCREDANLEIKMEICGWRFSKDMLSGWSCFPIRKRGKKLWLAELLIIIWAIWKERNRVVFEDVAFSPKRMKLSFVSTLIS